eukprot:6778999-Prymnesium_polylepis.1
MFAVRRRNSCRLRQGHDGTPPGSEHEEPGIETSASPLIWSRFFWRGKSLGADSCVPDFIITAFVDTMARYVDGTRRLPLSPLID